MSFIEAAKWLVELNKNLLYHRGALSCLTPAQEYDLDRISNAKLKENLVKKNIEWKLCELTF